MAQQHHAILHSFPDIRGCIIAHGKIDQVFPSTVAYCKQPLNEANIMKHWENYATCKVWTLIEVKLYSQLNNYQKFIQGGGFVINFRDCEMFLGTRRGGIPLNL